MISLAPYKYAIEQIPGHTHVHDLGCGDAWYRESFLKRECTFRGFDVEPRSEADHWYSTEEYFKHWRTYYTPDYFTCFHSLYNFKDQLKNLYSAKKGFVIVETNGSCLLGNVWRAITRKPRRDGLFTRKDIMEKFSGRGHNVRYFDFLTMLPLGERWYGLVEPIDNFLLNKLGLTFLAWKFVVSYHRENVS